MMKITIVDTQPPPRVFAPTDAMMVLRKLFIELSLKLILLIL
jgi:hypothetical protein